ncbi:hypothetical protein GH714_025758 [Hevea brasiliensis]|uniref:Uncharacterized protein n=1 Tax=Hevea brasiliensis TaxID=3981 RepID=A0A6A6M7T9_HEVBR|nr:hypothetical protein GH714_025758 [Hevea brasiliensis]
MCTTSQRRTEGQGASRRTSVLQVSQQGLKKHHKHKYLIGVAPESSLITGSNKEIEEHSDVASTKALPKAMGAGAPTMSQQGLKKKYPKHRKLIEVALETSPTTDSNKEIEDQLDVASAKAFPKATGAPIVSQQGLKKKYHKHRKLIRVASETSPIVGSKKEIEEQSDVTSAKAFQKAMGAPTMPQQGLKKKYHKHRKFIGVAPETSLIASSNKEIEEQSDVASAKPFPNATGAGASIVSQQGLKMYHKHRKLIGVALETSLMVGNNEIEQSDVASAKASPKAMGAGASIVSQEGLKNQYHKYKKLPKAMDAGLKNMYHKHRRLIGVAPETSLIAGSNKEIDEQSEVASAKGFPKAMGPVAVPP